MNCSVFNCGLAWLPQDSSTLEIIYLMFSTDCLIPQRHNEKFFEKNVISGDGFEQILNFTKNGELMEPLKYRGKDCFAVYGSNSSRYTRIYCLKVSAKNASLSFHQEDEIDRHAKQVLALAKRQIAILVEHKVEIWNITEKLKLHQQLRSLGKAKQIATGSALDGSTYLAVTTTNRLSKLIPATVELYSATSADFKHQQTLEFDVEPQQVAFSFLNSSQDLLLFVRIAAADKSILIYQLKGVMGFQLISGPNTLLEPALHIQVVDLKAANKQFLALFGTDNAVSFVDFRYKVY